MKSKAVSGIMLTLLLTSMVTLAFNIQKVKSEPATIVVPDDYAKIQWAVDNATVGDTILVKSGIYYGHVIINKSISLIGENKSTTIIDGNHTGNAIWVDAPVTISGFTIRNAEYDCIHVGEKIDGNSFSDNIMKDGSAGVGMVGSRDNIVSDNVMDDCWRGIVVCGRDNRITGNIIFNANQGIDIDNSNNVIENNFVHHNNYGITLGLSRNSVIHSNVVSNNTCGISVYHYSYENLIFHNNFINNTQQAKVSMSFNNTWNNGYPSGGNYWSDYAGVDLNHDGIGDTPYVIDEDNQDNYPLMVLWSPVEEGPLWMQWWFWTIIMAGITVLAGAVYFLKKRKPPTPTASSPPTEGTETSIE